MGISFDIFAGMEDRRAIRESPLQRVERQMIILTPNSFAHLGHRTVCFPVLRGRHNSALQCGQVR